MPRTFLGLENGVGRLLGVENEIWHLLVIQRETVLHNTVTLPLNFFRSTKSSLHASRMIRGVDFEALAVWGEQQQVWDVASGKSGIISSAALLKIETPILNH